MKKWNDLPFYFNNEWFYAFSLLSFVDFLPIYLFIFAWLCALSFAVLSSISIKMYNCAVIFDKKKNTKKKKNALVSYISPIYDKIYKIELLYTTNIIVCFQFTVSFVSHRQIGWRQKQSLTIWKSQSFPKIPNKISLSEHVSINGYSYLLLTRVINLRWTHYESLSKWR